MALEQLQQGKVQEAKKACELVLETHTKFTAPKTDATANDYLLFGLIAEQKGDRSLAAQCYKTALEYFTFAAVPKHKMFDLGTCSLLGGKAVAAQALGEALRKQGNVKAALDAKRLAKKLWSQNPDWTPVKKLDEVTFFLLFGQLPSTKAKHS